MVSCVFPHTVERCMEEGGLKNKGGGAVKRVFHHPPHISAIGAHAAGVANSRGHYACQTIGECRSEKVRKQSWESKSDPLDFC
eukprot:478600-Pelagomonas_calceolata.AAC.6